MNRTHSDRLIFTGGKMFVFLVAFTQIYAFAADCDKLNSPKKFYECSLSRHPKIEIAQMRTKEGDALIEQASQFQNPDFSVKSVSGSQGGENVGSTEIAVNIPISQLWTRGPSKDVARAEKKIVDIDSQLDTIAIKKELILDLYRVRQIDENFVLLDETLSSFEKIRNQYASRRAKGPDQEITLNLIQLATSDYQLKRNHLVVERGEILSRLKALWGGQFEVKKEIVPSLRTKWPEISEKAEASNNLNVQRALAQGEKARAEASLAIREALPALSIGPAADRNTTGPTQIWSYGVNVNVRLPLFSLNLGSKKLAETRGAQAVLESSYEAKKFEYSKDILIQKYRSAVQALAKSSKQDELTKKHSQVDSYFRQGLATSTIMIEAHRQIIEYTESQNEHERSAIEAYIDLMTLTGGSFEGIIE